MDKIQTQFNSSIFSEEDEKFFNPQVSWRNKWKGGDKTKGEKFLFSSTLLVGFTDFWHLCKMLQVLVVVAGVLTAPDVVRWFDFAYLLAVYFVVFELMYSKFLNKQ